MAYTRPSSNPDWAQGSSVYDDITVTTGRNVSNAGLPLSVGYADSSAPTAKGWNYWIRLIGLWIGWLDQVTQTQLDLIVASGSFNATFGSNIVFAFTWQKFNSGTVKIWWSGQTGMTSGFANYAVGNPLPSAIQPAADTACYTITKSGSTLINSAILFMHDSTIGFKAIDGSTVFTEALSGCVNYKI